MGFRLFIISGDYFLLAALFSILIIMYLLTVIPLSSHSARFLGCFLCFLCLLFHAQASDVCYSPSMSYALRLTLSHYCTSYASFGSTKVGPHFYIHELDKLHCVTHFPCSHVPLVCTRHYSSTCPSIVHYKPKRLS